MSHYILQNKKGGVFGNVVLFLRRGADGYCTSVQNAEHMTKERAIWFIEGTKEGLYEWHAWKLEDVAKISKRDYVTVDALATITPEDLQ